jgi:DNA-binding transcriptional ArsR family regulator
MDTDAIHKALANPARRQILAWLKEPDRYFAAQVHPLEFGVCAGLIDSLTGLSQSTTSAHLAALEKAGLVSKRKVGQWMFFKRDEETIAAFLAQLQHGL